MSNKKHKLLLIMVFILEFVSIPDADPSDTAFNSQFISSKPVDTLQQQSRDTLSELPRLTVIPEKNMKDAFVTSSSEFKATELLHTAGTANDINRVLALHPAVTTINTVDNNSLNIRGGEVLENIYIIDGIEFETISHYSSEKTSGAIGFITADNVDRVRINMVMQPSLTPRNSSVIEIDLKDIPDNRFEGQVDLSISGLSLQMQGKTEQQTPAFLFHCRWMDMKPLEKFTRGVWSQYGDLLLKGITTLNDNQSLGLVAVISYDKMRAKTTWDKEHPDADYQKELLQAGFGILHKFSKGNIHNQVTLSAGVGRDRYIWEGTYTTEVPVWKDTFVIWDNGDTTIRRERRVIVSVKDSIIPLLLTDSYKNRVHILLNESISINLSNKLDAEAGVRVKGTDLTNTEKAYHFEFGDSVPLVYETGGYVQGQFKHEKVTIITGARCDYFSSIDDFGIAPYIGCIYDKDKFSMFKLQCAYSYQEPPAFLKYSQWYYIKPVDVSGFALQRCLQGSLLYERTFESTVFFSTELYGKYYNREYPFKLPYIAGVGSTNSWKIPEADGKKAAVGLEVCIHNESEKIFRYRVALALGKVKNRFTDYKWYNDENDIRAALKMVLCARLKKYHDFSFSSIIADGRPYSSTDPFTPRSEWFVRRFDPTFFISARYSFIYTGNKMSIGAYVDVQNILNQTHVVSMQEIDSYTRAPREMDGILPTAGMTVSF